MINIQKILNIRFKLNQEFAPMEGRQLHLNEDITIEIILGDGKSAENYIPRTRFLGFDIKYSSNVDPESYEVWIDKVRYIV